MSKGKPAFPGKPNATTVAALKGAESGGEMKGLFSSLTPDQQAKALAYRGAENHGDPAFPKAKAALDAMVDKILRYRPKPARRRKKASKSNDSKPVQRRT